MKETFAWICPIGARAKLGKYFLCFLDDGRTLYIFEIYWPQGNVFDPDLRNLENILWDLWWIIMLIQPQSSFIPIASSAARLTGFSTSVLVFGWIAYGSRDLSQAETKIIVVLTFLGSKWGSKWSCLKRKYFEWK